MRRAFVLQLALGTDPSRQHLEGCVEEVDTGRELRFRSTEELVAFLADCFERGGHADRHADRRREGS